MVRAQERQIGERRFTAVDPRHDVMGVASRVWDVAVGEDAAPIPEAQGPSDGGGHESARPSDIQDFRPRPQYHRNQVCVAAEAPELTRAQLTRPGASCHSTAGRVSFSSKLAASSESSGGCSGVR